MTRKSKRNRDRRGPAELMKATWKEGENPFLEFLLGPTPGRKDGLRVVDFLLEIAAVTAMKGSGVHQDILAEATDNLTEIGEKIYPELRTELFELEKEIKTLILCGANSTKRPKSV